MILVPCPDAAQVSRAALVINDEGHDAMVQALLEHNQSTHATVTVFEGEDLLKRT